MELAVLPPQSAVTSPRPPRHTLGARRDLPAPSAIPPARSRPVIARRQAHTPDGSLCTRLLRRSVSPDVCDSRLIWAPALAAVGCGRAPTTAGAPVPASAIGRLTAIAHRAAAINGDPAPGWITAVITTHAKALTSATPGDYVPGSAHVKVFLITMRGHFTAKEATVPPRARTAALGA
jgi:hypothetical protein